MVVLHKNGWWYFKTDSYQSLKAEETRVNGKRVTEVRDKTWFKTKEKPKTLSRLITPPAKLLRYDLKPEHAGLNLPKTQEVGFFGDRPWYDADEGEARPNEELYGLYSAVYDEPTPEWEEQGVEWEFVDLDCEPVAMTLPVKIDFPHSVEEHKVCWHKYPCSLSGNHVFDMLWDRLHAVIKDAKTLTMDDYKTIRTLTVYKTLILAEPETRKVDVSKFGARKPKYANRTFTTTKIEVLAWHGPEYDSRHPEAKKCVPKFRGANYADLEAQVEAWIAEEVAKLDDSKAQICPRCKGIGLVVL